VNEPPEGAKFRGPMSPVAPARSAVRTISGTRPQAPPVYRPGAAQLPAPAPYRPQPPVQAIPAQRLAAPPAFRQYQPNRSCATVQPMRWRKQGQDIIALDPGHKLPPRGPIPAFGDWKDGDIWNDETGLIRRVRSGAEAFPGNGEAHRAISDLFAGKKAAYDLHLADLMAEATPKSSVIHGRSRHGYQTGLEGQLGRASSKKTPDQPDDRMGSGVQIRDWTTSKGVERTIDHKGLPIDKAASVAPKHYPKASTSGGPYAGSFFSPEIQNRLVVQALALAAPFLAYDQAEFESGWQELQYLDVVVKGQPGGYGVSFSAQKGSNTEYAIKMGLPSPISQVAAVGRDREHDEGLRGTITYTPHGKDVYLMMCAKVQLRRKPGLWEVLSSFPENMPPGVSPIFKHGEELWRGKLKNSKTNQEETKPVPPWPKKVK
jgi:hypothetical protein